MLTVDWPDADVTRLAHCEPLGHDFDAGPIVPLQDLADATFVELLSSSPLRAWVRCSSRAARSAGWRLKCATSGASSHWPNAGARWRS